MDTPETDLSPDDVLPPWPNVKRPGRAAIAARTGLLAAGLIAAASAMTAVMLRLAPEQPHVLGVSAVFFVTTAVLAAASAALQRAVRWVRVEKQRPFRSWLVVALGLGVLFTALQAYGLADLGPSLRAAVGGEPNPSAFVAAIVATHAAHVVLAVMSLALVTVQALNDRYDHEYYWGVSAVAGFWHFLGLVWLSVLSLSCLAM